MTRSLADLAANPEQWAHDELFRRLDAGEDGPLSDAVCFRVGSLLWRPEAAARLVPSTRNDDLPVVAKTHVVAVPQRTSVIGHYGFGGRWAV